MLVEDWYRKLDNLVGQVVNKLRSPNRRTVPSLDRIRSRIQELRFQSQPKSLADSERISLQLPKIVQLVI